MIGCRDHGDMALVRRTYSNIRFLTSASQSSYDESTVKRNKLIERTRVLQVRALVPPGAGRKEGIDMSLGDRNLITKTVAVCDLVLLKYLRP